MVSFTIYIILFLSLVNFYMINTTNVASNSVNSGPYRTLLLRTERCKKTRYPQHPNSPLTLHFESYNNTSKSFFSGNFTVKRYVKNVKTRIKSSIWEKGKWRPNFLLPTTGCHSVLMQTIHAIFSIKYDEKYCAYYQGNYTFEDVDTNVYQHKLMSSAVYGRSMWFAEMYLMGKQFFSLACWEFEGCIVPK